MDEYINGLLMALGFGTLTAGMLAGGCYGVRRMFSGSSSERIKLEETKKRVIESLAAITSIGNMKRIWYDGQGHIYKDATGKPVQSRPLGQETRRYTPSELRWLSLEDITTELEIRGEVLEEANAFSFTKPIEVHRDYVLGILYHQI